MSTSKHDKGRDGEGPFESDLERNPGIGQSKGSFMTGQSPEEIEGDNTVEGDVDNDARLEGSIQDYEGRTNR